MSRKPIKFDEDGLPIPIKEQQPVSFDSDGLPIPIKKKVGTVSFGETYSSPELDSETPSTSEIPTVVDYGDGEPLPNNIVDLSRKATEYSKKTKEIERTDMRGNPIPETIPDESFIGTSKKIIEDLDKQGIKKDFVDAVSELPDEAFNDPNTSKDKLVELYKTNRIKFHQFVNEQKNRIAIKRGAFENQKNANNGIDDIDPNQMAIHVANKYLGTYEEAHPQNLNQLQNIISKKQDIIEHSLIGEERTKALDRVRESYSSYINPTNPDIQAEYEQSPLKNKVDITQYSALKTLQLFDAKKYEQAVNILNTDIQKQYTFKPEFENFQSPVAASPSVTTSDSTLAAKNKGSLSSETIDQQIGKESVLRQLTELGRNNLVTQINSQQYDLEQAFNNTDNAEEKEAIKQQYVLNQGKLAEVSKNASQDKIKFPLTSKLEFDNQVKELVQDAGMGAVEYGTNKFAHGVGIGGESFEDMAVSIFGSEKDKALLGMKRIGESKWFESKTYLPEDYRSTGSPFIMQPSPALKDAAKEIMGGKKLSDLSADQKQQLTELVINNPSQIETVTNPKAGKSKNFFSKATLYSNTGFIGEVGAFMYKIMGAKSLGLSGKSAELLTLYNDGYSASYTEKLKEGASAEEANQYGVLHGGVMLLAGTVSSKFDAVKDMLAASKSPISKQILGLGEAGWDAIVNKNKSTISKIANGVSDVVKSNAKMIGTYGVGVSIASDLADKGFFNKDISVSEMADNVKHSAIDMAIGSVGLAGIGFISHAIKNPVTLKDKATIWEIGDNKEFSKQRIDEAVAKNELTQAEGDAKKKVIDNVASLIDKVPTENSKGKLLTDNEKVKLLYNLILKEKGKEAAKDLPDNQSDKAEHIALVADYANGIILENPTDKQLESRKSTLEKQIEGKDENGKPLLPEKELLKAKAQLEAVNDAIQRKENGVEVQAPINTGESIPLKTEEQSRNENGIVVEKPMVIPEPITISSEPTKTQPTNEAKAPEVQQSPEVKEPTITEANKTGQEAETAVEKEEQPPVVPPVTQEFDKMATSIPNGGEVKKYLSGDTIKKYEEGTELRNNQEITAQELEPALKHGVETIDKAKEIFGDEYVEKTLDYVEREKLNPENKALLYVSLENDMAKRILAEPDNLGLKKLQDLVRTKSQAYLRSNSLAINMGRLRKFAEAGYDISKVTDKFFSSKELEQKAEIEKAVQADAETIQKQYEESKQEVSGFSEADIEAKVKEGIESEIAKIYEALPKEKKTAVDKAISALDKIHEKLKSKTYSDATGMTALVDAGVVTIRAALKAGVTAAKAVELGIAKIKKAYEEKYGKKWEKEDEFRKDYLDGLKEQGVIDAQQRRLAKKEYQMLETERNRQLAKVADLTEKLNTLQKGERPATNTKELKPDVPEIEALKAKVKEETKKLNALDAQQRRIDGLETELDRLQNRLPKEKSETVKREISDKEQELKGKIEVEKEIIRKENKENNQLRLSDAKDAVRQRIEKIKTEIANKERELKEQNKPLNDDLELTRLREVENQITELRDKYLPEEKDPYEAEKQRERVKDKLVADIIGLNDQINAGERNKKSDKPNYENDAEINKLKKIREDKKAILNEIDPLAVPKEKTTAERKVDAENNLQKKIDDIREEILNGEREVSKSKDKIQSKKLIQLREQKKALEALRDKYLPKGEDPYADSKAAKLVEDKLIKENIELNRQILKGEKDVKENKVSPESEIIDKLKAERDARKEILEAIDPTPKQYIENALIEQGFGKTIKIKTKNGLEERQVLDWKKLAGEEGSVSKISENVSKSLEKSGFTAEQLDRISDSFITEYTNIRKAVIEKGLNELASRNKTTVTPAQKSAAKKLAEMYNYGLFDKEPIEFEKALAKTIGVDKLNEGRFQQVKELGDALATLFSSDFKGKRLSEREMKSAIQVVEDKMRHILHQEAKQHGSTPLMLADMARTYMDAVQRMTLNNLKQAVENPLSGKLEKIYSSIGYTKDMPKELGEQRRKMASNLYKEMVLQGGAAYGDVSSTFVNKGNLEMMLKNMPESKLLHGITSTLLGRSTLDAVDSFYKAKITNQKFTYNLIQILTKDRLINGKVEKGMSKEDAKKYVAEKLTGQSFKDAQETAKTIIGKVNEGKKEKILKDSPEFVDRLANDIVTASLVNGEKITEDMVTAAYNAAYKAAGRGLGHVANNWISRQVGNVTGEIETRINDAIKEKDYRKAAFLTAESIFFRNIANPFVGGGTNWVVLKAEKTGLGLVSGLGSMMRKGAKMDLSSEAGIKNLEKAMYENLKIKDKFIRGAVGGFTTALVASLFYGVSSSDEYRKWRSKNMWAARYLDTFTPEFVLAAMAAKDDKTKRYLEGTLNQNEQFDKTKKIMKVGVAVVKGNKQEALGQSGEVAGGIVGVPIPWRLVRDGQQIVQGLSGGEIYKVDNRPSKSLLEGYFKGGMIDYLGFAPEQPKSMSYTTEELKKPVLKLFIDKGVKMPEMNPEKIQTKEVNNKVTEKLSDYDEKTQKLFIDTKKKYLENELTKLKNNEIPVYVNKDGHATTEKDKNNERKYFNQLTADQIQNIISTSILKRVTEKVKKEVLTNKKPIKK